MQGSISITSTFLSQSVLNLHKAGTNRRGKGRGKAPAIACLSCSSSGSSIAASSLLLPQQLLPASRCKSAAHELVIIFTDHLLHLLIPMGKGWVQTVPLVPHKPQQWKLSFSHAYRTIKRRREKTLRQSVLKSFGKPCNLPVQLLKLWTVHPLKCFPTGRQNAMLITEAQQQILSHPSQTPYSFLKSSQNMQEK